MEEQLNNIFNNKEINKKDILIIILLAQICTTYDPTPNTFLYNLNKLIQLGLINIPNMIKYISDETNISKTILNQNTNINIFKNIILSKYKRDFIEIRNIGYGGFGDVYLVQNKLDNNYYAIKQVHYKYNNLNDINLEYIINEIKILSKLDHPNINRYYTSWIEPTWLYNYVNNNTLLLTDNINFEFNNFSHIILYIQLQYCNNNTLNEYLINRQKIDININYIIFYQILNGINYIHDKNIIHRDLKPSNIFIDDELSIKIGDFGLSKDITEQIKENEIKFSIGVGTNMYSSPEQLTNNIYNKKTDMYSLGLILLELFINYNTEFEKIKIFEKARLNPPIIPQHIKKKYKNIYKIIINLLSYDYNIRYDTKNLLNLISEIKNGKL